MVPETETTTTSDLRSSPARTVSPGLGLDVLMICVWLLDIFVSLLARVSSLADRIVPVKTVGRPLLSLPPLPICLALFSMYVPRTSLVV